MNSLIVAIQWNITRVRGVLTVCSNRSGHRKSLDQANVNKRGGCRLLLSRHEKPLRCERHVRNALGSLISMVIDAAVLSALEEGTALNKPAWLRAASLYLRAYTRFHWHLLILISPARCSAAAIYGNWVSRGYEYFYGKGGREAVMVSGC